MNSDILVTVFVPVYNAEKYIGECIESILSQTYQNFEILVVNDGSTDRSTEIINSYQDKRIRLVHNDKNRGIPYTRNRGLDLARGKYLAIMDSDDIAHPRRLEICVDYLEKHPESRVIGGMLDFIVNGKEKKGRRQIKTEVCQNYNTLFRCPLANSSAMVELDFLKTYGIRYNENCFVAQDYDFFVQCVPYTKIMRLGKILGWYRIGHENITSVSMREKREKRNQIIKSIRKKAFTNLGLTIEEDDFSFWWEYLSEERRQMTEESYQRLLHIFENLADQTLTQEKKELLQAVQRECVNVICAMEVSYARRRAYWKMARKVRDGSYGITAEIRLLLGR